MMLLALIIVMLLSLALGFMVAYLVFCRLLNPSALWKKPYPDYKLNYYCEDFTSKFDDVIRDVNGLERRVNSMNDDIQRLDRKLYDNLIRIKALEERKSDENDYDVMLCLQSLEERVAILEEDNKDD